LNARANQLAHYLRKQGVGPEVLVGICMERSLEMIVGLLGILKAGGAYVPLDPDYPAERLAFMLDDSRASMLLTQTRLVTELPVLAIQVVSLDTTWETVALGSQMNVRSAVHADNPAYVIYTSGSTGKAKGVTVAHSSMVNYLYWVNESLLQGTACKIPALTKPTFDASLKQLFTPLLRGDAVWLVSEEVVAQPSILLHLLDAQAVEAINCVPSLWQAMLNTLQFEQTTQWGKHLKFLLIGGESLDVDLVRKTREILPHLQIRNLYGPTEATANASEAKITATEAITIGRPIANTHIYLLDPSLNLVSVGVTGEIYIGGAGLARGYLKRPDLTAEKFIPNPFSNVPGARMYKTGDLARWLPDGNIKFLGRSDYQVKIRGFRIELGEIEATLAALPEVHEAVALAREDTPGDKRLVAYVVPQPEQAIMVAELRSALQASLPDYMLPSAFVFLEQLPLTPSGKVDRKALPAPDTTRSEVGYVGPRTQTEEILARIWAEVLKLDKVGIHDNFFELGGHSLLAVHLMTRVQQTFQRQIPLSRLFQSSTLAQFAALIAAHATPPWSPIVPIQPYGSQTPLFCIHPAGGFASDYTNLANRLGPDQPLYGLQSYGLDEKQTPHTSIEEMATCYREAIQQVQARGPYLLIGWSLGGTIAYEISQQLKQRGEEIAFLGLLDSQIGSDDPKPAGNSALIGYLRRARQPIVNLDQMISETDEDIIPKAFAIAQKAELVPPDFRLTDFQRILEVYKAHSQAAFTYQLQPYSGTATLFVCQEPSAKGITAAQSNISHWTSLVSNLELREVSGNHLNMMDPPHVDRLAAEIASCLRRVMN
ncbi:MAG: amino acid adenylation domain-containing protein, partial [Chloroflexi bacterium]